MTHLFTPYLPWDFSTLSAGDVVICTDEESPRNAETLAWECAQPFEQLLRLCTQLHLPLLAQGAFARLLARAYGGEIAPQSHKAEVGDVTVLALSPAREDLWCRSFAAEMLATSFRSDDILQLPLLALPLQNSELTQFQSFKIAGKNQYGVQWYAPWLHQSFIDFCNTYVYQKS